MDVRNQGTPYSNDFKASSKVTLMARNEDRKGKWLLTKGPQICQANCLANNEICSISS